MMIVSGLVIDATFVGVVGVNGTRSSWLAKPNDFSTSTRLPRATTRVPESSFAASGATYASMRRTSSASSGREAL
ncbi:MAG TPA: hypothetical protein VFG30_29450 [Polyangiales bacterium]|nr:hypothetical protein [Polyangiales bacterium]